MSWVTQPDSGWSTFQQDKFGIALGEEHSTWVGLRVRENFKSRRIRIGVWLALWALGCGISLLIWARPKTTPLQEDEIYWIGSAYYYDLAISHPDWRSPDWKLLPARENPPVAKYLIGLGLAATGQQVASPDLLGCFYAMFESIPGAWGSGPDYAKRAAVVARMSPALREQLARNPQIQLGETLLIPARIVMIGCSVLASLAILLCGWKFASAPAGWLASQALLVHPVVVDSYNHAMSDAVTLLFSTAAAGVTFIWTRSFLDFGQTHRKRGWLTLLAGAMLAFACGAKMNSLVVAILAGVAIAATAFEVWRRIGRTQAVAVLSYGAGLFAIAVAVFIAINPAILQDVPGGLAATVTEHRLTEAIQVKFLQGHLGTLGQKLNAVATMTAFHPAVGVLMAAGALACLRSKRPGVRFIAGWWLIAFVCVSAWIPFFRLRYVMPMIAPTVLLGAILVESLVMAILSRVKTGGLPAVGEAARAK